VSATSPRTQSRPAKGPARAWLPWAAMALVLVVALAIGATRTRGAESTQDRVTAIAKTIKCPTCRGESVADSNALTSREIRADIADRVEAGQTDDEIRAAYVSVYGADVQLTPSSSGVAGLVWAIPVVVIVVAGAGLVVVFRRWKAEGERSATDADRALVDAALARQGVVANDDATDRPPADEGST
jgi:cytochrome c-type biogenesis protein CcmH